MVCFSDPNKFCIGAAIASRSAIRYAPAGGNVRTVNYMLISDPAKITALSDAACEVFVDQQLVGPVYGRTIKQKMDRGLDPILCGAPHGLIADSPDESGVDMMNATVALTYAMLAAQTLGVGTCWCGLLQMAAMASKEVRWQDLGSNHTGLP